MTFPLLWSDAAVESLLRLARDDTVRKELCSLRNENAYKMLSVNLAQLGFDRSALQCRLKMKRLRIKYFRIKNGQDVLDKKTLKWYTQLDAIYGHSLTEPNTTCATSQTPVADTGGEATASPPVLTDTPDKVLSLSSLRLLLSPLQLMSAALWAVARHRAVMHYGLLDDFITAVLDLIPDLISRSEREQLLLGLRTKVVLEMCRTDDLCCRQNIEPLLTRISDLIKEQNEEKASSSKTKASVDNFLKVANTLLNDPYERAIFYEKTFPSVFGSNFDSALCDLVKKFLMNLEKLLPVPSLDQTSLWLGLSPPVLKECGNILNQTEPLSELIQQHKQDYDVSTGPIVNDLIFSSLSGQHDRGEDTESKTILKTLMFEDSEDDGLVPSVEVTLEDTDTEQQDCNNSEVDQTHSDHGRTLRCFVCGQTFSSLSELKKHIIPRCSADTEEKNMAVCLSSRFEISTNTSEEQVSKRSSRIKTCSVCGEIFSSAADLINHMRAHTENESQDHFECDEDFDSHDNFVSHQNNECQMSKGDLIDVDCSQEMQQKEMRDCVVLITRISEDMVTSPQTSTTTCRVLGKDLEIHQRIGFQKNQTEEAPTNSDVVWIQPCELSSMTSLSDAEQDSESTINQSSLESENSTTFLEGIFRCTLCNETSTYINDMKFHYHSSHNIDGPYQCPKCKRFFVRICELLRHNNNQLQCQCTICKRCFLLHADLIRHNKYFHDTYSTSYACEICGKRYLSDSGLKSHRRWHMRIKNTTTVCSYCGKNFSSEACLRTHMVRHTGGFTCPICSKKFNHKIYFQYHMNKHNGVIEPYMCEICGKHYPSKTYLRKHMTEHSVDRPHKCDKCDATYKSMSALRYHLRSKHSSLKPFKCSVCDATFIDKGGLNGHIIIHSDARPFVCSACGNAFRRADTLKTHMKTHQREKSV